MKQSDDAYAGFDDKQVPDHMVGLLEAQTLDGLFRARVKRTPNSEAYRFFSKRANQWQSMTWQQIADQVARWQSALKQEGLESGDRVAVMMDNCVHWPILDQAALGMGLVMVPLYANDRPDNLAYVLQNSESKFLLIKEQEQADKLVNVADKLQGLIVRSVLPVECEPLAIQNIDDWLPDSGEWETASAQPNDLASIVYTSGTTGAPKGVMLSHKNMLWNAWAGLHSIMVYPEDIHLSFLPLSHTLERTVGYYLMMMVGATVAYNRSIPELGEDLLIIKPTIMVAVPRIFERVHGKIIAKVEQGSPIKRFLFNQAVAIGWQRFEYQQGRANKNLSQIFFPILDKLVGSKIRERLGGRLRLGIVGGAALSEEVGKLFLSLGVPLVQGYGLTETSPILSVNKPEQNDPTSVGFLLRDVKIKNDPETGELIVNSPGVMQGYWKNEAATNKDADAEGWLRTGDIASLSDGFLKITGRVKEIIVLANGEKIPPTDVESAIALDSLIEQVMVIGEGKPFLSALLVLNEEEKAAHIKRLQRKGGDVEAALQADIKEKVRTALRKFPGYARIYEFAVIDEEWTIDNELMTPTLKIRRARIMAKFEQQIAALYEGHS